MRTILIATDFSDRSDMALERAALPGAPTERGFRDWLARMDHVAADSLGTLIDRLRRELARAGTAEPELMADLDDIRDWRNLLCHAVWRPMAQDGWQPVFADNRGALFDRRLDADDLAAIRARTLDAANRIGRLIQAANDEGWETGD